MNMKLCLRLGALALIITAGLCGASFADSQIPPVGSRIVGTDKPQLTLCHVTNVAVDLQGRIKSISGNCGDGWYQGYKHNGLVVIPPGGGKQITFMPRNIDSISASDGTVTLTEGRAEIEELVAQMGEQIFAMRNR